MTEIRVSGPTMPASLDDLSVGMRCPHCGQHSHFASLSHPNRIVIARDGVDAFTSSHACNFCHGEVPITWHVNDVSGHDVIVSEPRMARPALEPFEYAFVPPSVRKEIEEALLCLSIGSLNGFAALCRRAIQALSVDLGATASSRVKRQIKQMTAAGLLTPEYERVAEEIMVAGHDGSHPHLPAMDRARSTVMLSLLRELIEDLYSRPGRIGAAAAASAELRQQAINRAKDVQT